MALLLSPAPLSREMEFPVMNSETEAPLPSGISEAKKQRGRPANSATETHRQKIERLQAELKDAQEALRASEEKRALIAGHAALRHARHNAEFARLFAAALRAEVKAKGDLAAIKDLLGDDPAVPPHGG
jgi:hypothetical protein